MNPTLLSRATDKQESKLYSLTLVCQPVEEKEPGYGISMRDFYDIVTRQISCMRHRVDKYKSD